jgi:hypothetical protein
MRNILFTSLIGLAFAGTAQAGPFAPAAGVAGSNAIGKDSPAFVQWATGYSNYLPGPNVDATWRTPDKALGAALGSFDDIVVLGDGGRITLSFDGYITNGAGADFAVFENSFSNTFLELAFVEVSSNGSDFVRFPTFSFTASPVGGFGLIDPTNVDGLAGKYRAGFGTPFDLDLLRGAANLDVNKVQYVRLIDVVGNGSTFDSFPAQYGGPHPIYDPYPTTGSSGFDLEAVGVIHYAAATGTGPVIPSVPEPSQWAMYFAALGLLGFVARRRS